MVTPKKNVVVLGAGFGGLRAAKLIAKKLRRLRLLDRYEVFLIDRSEHHTYTPLLYEVATTSKETANACKLHSVATYPVKTLLGRLPVTFLQKELTALDLVEGDLHFADGEKVVFDHLVIALGAETNYFNIAGLKEYALPLKTFNDAIHIRDSIWTLALERQGHIRIVIGGGGPTGVELGGELKAWCGELEKEFRACKLEVILVEGNPTILPGFEPRVITHATDRLKALGVEIINGERIASVQKDVVFLTSGRALPFDVCLWSGGVKAPSVLTGMPLQAEPKGRPIAQGVMECLPQTPDLKLHSKIYGLGDSVCFNHPVTGKPIPSVARAALSQATVVAHNVVADIKAVEFPTKSLKLKAQSYVPHEYPYVIPIGGKYALAKVGPFLIKGFFGWVLKGLVELNYLLSVMSPWRAFYVWFKGLSIFIKNDRLG
jgi:NADH dehydrogenase